MNDDELQRNLTEYGQLNDRIKILETQKDLIKDNLYKYLKDNEYITEADSEIKFDTKDSNEQMWRLTSTKQNRPKPDWNYIKSILPADQYKTIRNENEITVFSARRIKSNSDENDAAMLAPPVSNV